MLIKLKPGVDFTFVLRAAFTHTDLKCAKKTLMAGLPGQKIEKGQIRPKAVSKRPNVQN